MRELTEEEVQIISGGKKLFNIIGGALFGGIVEGFYGFIIGGPVGFVVGFGHGAYEGAAMAVVYEGAVILNLK